MTLDEFIDALHNMRARICEFHKLQGGDFKVVMWPPGDDDDFSPVVGLEYDKFSDDEPWVVIICKAGDPGHEEAS